MSSHFLFLLPLYLLLINHLFALFLLIDSFLLFSFFWKHLNIFLLIEISEILFFKFLGIFSRLLVSLLSKSDKVKLIVCFLGRNPFAVFKLSFLLLLFLFNLFYQILFISSFYRFDCWPWLLFRRYYWVNYIIVINLIVIFHSVFFLLFDFHLFFVFLFELILLLKIISHSVLFFSLIFHFFYSNLLILLFFSSLLLKSLFLMTLN